MKHEIELEVYEKKTEIFELEQCIKCNTEKEPSRFGASFAELIVDVVYCPECKNMSAVIQSDNSEYEAMEIWNKINKNA